MAEAEAGDEGGGEGGGRRGGGGGEEVFGGFTRVRAFQCAYISLYFTYTFIHLVLQRRPLR